MTSQTYDLPNPSKAKREGDLPNPSKAKRGRPPQPLQSEERETSPTPPKEGLNSRDTIEKKGCPYGQPFFSETYLYIIIRFNNCSFQ